MVIAPWTYAYKRADCHPPLLVNNTALCGIMRSYRELSEGYLLIVRLAYSQVTNLKGRYIDEKEFGFIIVLSGGFIFPMS